MRVASLLVLVACVAACGGGASTLTQRPSTAQPTTAAATSPRRRTSSAATPGAATSEPATAAPAGGTTVSVILTGGPDAGTYTATDNPLCSYGVAGTGVWGAQFSVDGAPKKISVVQIVAPTSASGSDTKFSSLVSIGPLLTSTNYRLDDTNGSAQVTDNGATAVIHVTGTTEDGVGVERDRQLFGRAPLVGSDPGYRHHLGDRLSASLLMVSRQAPG